MELEHERHEVLARETAFAPVTLAQGFTADRVQVEHRILFSIGFARPGVVAGYCSQQGGMPSFVGVLHVPDLQAWVLCLDVIDQVARWQDLPAGGRIIEARVEPLINLVLKGQDTPGDTSQR
ncbi:hypothetical protein D3C76_974000 [compost metagenome]